MTADPQIVHAVILAEDETAIAAVAVRMYLGHLRGKHRKDLRRGEHQYAARCVEKFDAALDLYERLGGDPAQVLDIQPEGPRP